MDFPGGSDDKESTCNAGDLGSTLGLEGNGNAFQYSCLENFMDIYKKRLGHRQVSAQTVCGQSDKGAICRPRRETSGESKPADALTLTSGLQ